MANWQRPDLIRQLLPNVDSAEVERLRLVADEKLKIEKFQIMERAVSKLPLASDLTNPLTIDLSAAEITIGDACLLYTSPSPRDATLSRMPSSA